MRTDPVGEGSHIHIFAGQQLRPCGSDNFARRPGHEWPAKGLAKRHQRTISGQPLDRG